MNFDIGLILGMDGITNGALYAMMSIALVMVFMVTRVIMIPLGDFVVLAAMTLAGFQAGTVPATLYLMLGLNALVLMQTLWGVLRGRRTGSPARVLIVNLALPILVVLLCRLPVHMAGRGALDVLLTALIVVPMGPLLYDLAFKPLANTSVLILFIAAIAVHFILVGIGLLCFGPGGVRTEVFSEHVFQWGSLTVSGQSLWVLGSCTAMILVLYMFFGRALYGKALTASAVNRAGARLVGISPDLAGRVSFLIAALIGTLAGVLIGPITTLYYDSGFIIGLKGFVGGIIGGLSSFPLAAIGAIFVGVLESVSSFYASGYKEIIVFTLIIPVLFWLSLRASGKGGDS